MHAHRAGQWVPPRLDPHQALTLTHARTHRRRARAVGVDIVEHGQGFRLYSLGSEAGSMHKALGSLDRPRARAMPSSDEPPPLSADPPPRASASALHAPPPPLRTWPRLSASTHAHGLVHPSCAQYAHAACYIILAGARKRLYVLSLALVAVAPALVVCPSSFAPAPTSRESAGDGCITHA